MAAVETKFKQEGMWGDPVSDWLQRKVLLSCLHFVTSQDILFRSIDLSTDLSEEFFCQTQIAV